MKYPKIKSLFKRDKEFKFTETFVSACLADFKSFRWFCQEKLDGMNIRFFCDYENQDFKYLGRTDRADIPKHLQETLNPISMRIKEKDISEILPKTRKFILYGEGFGYKIQKVGGLYLGKEIAFNLFDCYVFMPEGKSFWLEQSLLVQLAKFLDLTLAPEQEDMTMATAIEKVKRGFSSKYGTAQAEGLILKTRWPLFDSFGNRLIFKLKTKDFQKGLKNDF